ncbi:hypothetical protein PSN45_002655 [Yamadazyma tenuis]|uniref:Amino acid transporter transmembrane domain-containing protein n=1 Tax=Candida tenuis (strain ATCC 10573 / BCRC 21748 / CBS 615 / JCM 9827 / NBRC 10315 / NRRL Y-1498 / VKM Y-70) TaxID=590646 RepID=G3AX93_CANTC|nr:uncharacterized protein CANTEDRAFT_117944 [Yamadazyma tenuis ATCC 10573]EGV66721.1 hypothetical protein CANTEDRAFT_117944 [Yamadazyma tenuis ATCC 10573]WEJ95143.1 hypothetical protein PSN45_002655 [Yamadazyma tenuis]
MSGSGPKKTNIEVNIKPECSDENRLEGGLISSNQDEYDVFATKDNKDKVDFRGLTCFGAAILITKTQIGLGVLGLPSTMNVLGFLPGMVCLIVLCILSTWTGVEIGRFRLNHPSVYGIDDATDMIFGKYAREVMGFGFWLFYTLLYGATLLTLSIAFNSLTGHPICSVAWSGIGAVVALILGISIRTMKVLSALGYIAVGSIFLAVWVVAIACLTQGTPSAAPDPDNIDKMIRVASTGVPFKSIASAIATQLLSLAGTPAFFTIHAEMKDQKQYIKALFLGQGFVVFNYIAISVIVYAKVGQYVASPALGSAGPLFQKISYGIGLPALFFACFFQAHISAKYALVRILRNSMHLQSNSKTHWATWISMMSIVIAIGFVVAGAIPFFDDLLGLIGALLGSFFTLIIPGTLVLWEIDRRFGPDEKSNTRWFTSSLKYWNSGKHTAASIFLSHFCIVSGIFILFTGVYGSIASIVDGYADGTVSSAFSCADNS